MRAKPRGCTIALPPHPERAMPNPPRLTAATTIGPRWNFSISAASGEFAGAGSRYVPLAGA